MPSPYPTRTKRPPLAFALFAIVLLLRTAFSQDVESADEETPELEVIDIEIPVLEEVWADFYKGNYQSAIRDSLIAAELDPWIVEWEIIAARSMLATGHYQQAFDRLSEYVERQQYELRARLLLREAALYTDNAEMAEEQLNAMSYLIGRRGRRYYDPNDVVAIGEAALLVGIEPKIVLENFFKRIQGEANAPASAFLAAGNLALNKHDYALASRNFQEGLNLHPENPELLLGLAQSYREGDSSKLIEYAEKALLINPKYAAPLVLVAQHLIAAEAYQDAEIQLNLALKANPLHPEALAYKAVLAYIQNDTDLGELYRETALSTWKGNPLVDHTIGRELSKKYRFEDGASSQRIALELDSEYMPARIQLAQDLLRLGRNAEAWQHATAVHDLDPYDIAAYNLVTLHDRLEEYATVSSDNFLIRLASHEADVYGQRAIRLLEAAHANLTQRYDIELPQKTQVEIYAEPADFETRTFGMPGNAGYLGVCFGPVFTINSPATRSSNWESVLYHEFTHTITLTLTNNRMPRWLSEGVSVFEEQVYNPAWGQRMSADYRDRILRDEMQPISNMSASFLQASDGDDIQFAYYQSYLIVEYFDQTYGMDALKALLHELAKGTNINEALAAHMAPLEKLDSGFKEFAQSKAEQLASDYRFDQPEGIVQQALDALNPRDNYNDALSRAKELLSEEKWNMAIGRLENLIADTGYLTAGENAHAPLAAAYRETGRLDEEKKTLETIVAHETHSLRPITRLLEIAENEENTEAIQRWSEAWLSINPMGETPWRSLLSSATQLENNQIAIEAATALVALDPADIASIHFQLAQQYKNLDTTKAKRHTLMALEFAPRFQKAYNLLAELKTAEQDKTFQNLNLDLTTDLSIFETQP